MTENEDGSKYAARVNAARGKSDSEQWFSHETSSAEVPKSHSRIRPEASEILAKIRQPAGSMARLAGFSNDSNEANVPICRRLRSAEAKAIAQKMARSTDNWSDFEGNLAAGLVKQPHRFGASIEAKASNFLKFSENFNTEIMEVQTHKCDWFTHDEKPVDTRLRFSRPATAQARSSNFDWFSHDSTNQSIANTRRSCRRVRGDGVEYALRNHGHKDLLTPVLPEDSVLPLYRCPTKESQNYCRHNKESSSVAECMKNLTLPEKTQHESRSEKVRSPASSNWDSKANTATNRHTDSIFTMEPENAGSIQAQPKELSKTQMARCIAQMDKDAPPTPRRHMLHVSEEAKSTYHKNRNGQMATLIGNGANSTTYNYPPKIQIKTVNSEEAMSNQEKARGTAVRTLLTHTDLREIPPRRINPPSDQVKIALGGESAKPLAPPPRRLMSAEARSYADRQRGTMRDLLAYS
ncbi:unnamed protein product [Rodentolepis nana]|uniref:DUF4378 domain-containing protein n=1 Tax=Rodentolepis nana TaxID=102285 RepID=A0A158QH38_RODNA|nr:unnamed protein product [Rodentolepis nana]